MRIAVVGTGYVGLVSGTCLTETGITVTCVAVDGLKIRKSGGYELESKMTIFYAHIVYR